MKIANKNKNKTKSPILLKQNEKFSELREYTTTVETTTGPQEVKIPRFNSKAGGLENVLRMVRLCEEKSNILHLTGPLKHHLLSHYLGNGIERDAWTNIIDNLNNNQMGPQTFDRHCRQLYAELYGPDYGKHLFKYVTQEMKKPKGMDPFVYKARFTVMKGYLDKVDIGGETMPSDEKWLEIYTNMFDRGWVRNYMRNKNSTHPFSHPDVTVNSITRYMTDQDEYGEPSAGGNSNGNQDEDAPSDDDQDDSNNGSSNHRGKRNRSRSKSKGKKKNKKDNDQAPQFKCKYHETNGHHWNECSQNPSSPNFWRKKPGRGRGRGRGRGQGGYPNNNNWSNNWNNNQGQGRGRGNGGGQYSYQPFGQGMNGGNPSADWQADEQRGEQNSSSYASFNVPSEASGAHTGYRRPSNTQSTGYPIDWGRSRLNRQGGNDH